LRHSREGREAVVGVNEWIQLINYCYEPILGSE